MTTLADQTENTTDLEALESEKLVQLATGTDRESERAWRILYQRHNGHLLNFLTRHRKLPPAVAEEVSSTVWRQAFKHAHNFDPNRAKFTSWIFMIANRLTTNEYRDQDRSPLCSFSDLASDSEDGEDDWTFLDQTAAGSVGSPRNFTRKPDRTPAEKTEGREVRRIIWEEIQSLPDHQRAVAERRAKGMTYEEIADATGIKLGTVKSRLSRSRRALKEKLASRIDLERYLQIEEKSGDG